MPQSAVVLLTRLLPPRRPPGCLGRDALVARIAGALDGRLVAILAGAGYGKTTALTQALDRARHPWVWCSCDERLDAPLLLDHLVGGLSERMPGFGASLQLTGPPSAQVAALANEIVATLPEDLVIALDDVHALPEPAQEALAQLVHDLPPQIHFAVAGRRPLPFPLGRLRTVGAWEFGERDLAFDVQEATKLLRATAPELSTEQVRTIVERTEGWVAGLILAAQAAQEGVLEPGAGEGDHLFDYMAEEVFEAQDADLQRFLLDTAVLERFTTDLAAATSGRPDAAEVCRGLVQRHLFTIRLDAEGRWYRYHHLFQAFLRRRLAERGDAGVREQHRRAADAWMAAGEPGEAVGHYIAAADFTAAAAALDPIAEGMVNTPRASTLARWFSAIPDKGDSTTFVGASLRLVIVTVRAFSNVPPWPSSVCTRTE